MEAKEILNLYFGANVYPKEIIDAWDFVSLSSRDEEKIKSKLSDWKSAGYTTKKKTYSDFIAIKGVKKK